MKRMAIGTAFAVTLAAAGPAAAQTYSIGTLPQGSLAYTVGAAGPRVVVGIFLTIFRLFNVFAINQCLQYKTVGKWRSYPFGEGIYIALSLIAKSALMWQVYLGTVR